MKPQTLLLPRRSFWLSGKDTHRHTHGFDKSDEDVNKLRDEHPLSVGGGEGGCSEELAGDEGLEVRRNQAGWRAHEGLREQGG